MQEVSTLFGALSDPTRLRVLALLTHGELCVCQIEEVLRMPQSRISRHLMALRHAGLVSPRREGVWMHYSLAEPKDDLHARLIDCLRTCLQENAVVKEDVRRIAECPPIAAKCCDDADKTTPSSPPSKSGATRRSSRVQGNLSTSSDPVRSRRRGLPRSASGAKSE